MKEANRPVVPPGPPYVRSRRTAAGGSIPHPLAFFAILLVCSVPFWLLAQVFRSNALPDNIPVTDIGATLSPLVAACVLVHREDGWAGVRRLFARLLDYQRIRDKRWLVTALLLLPTLYGLTYLVMRILGLSVPERLDFSFGLWVPLVLFTIAAAVEELGYTAYATDALQDRFSALATSLLVGVPWALWHLPSMIQMGQSRELIVWGLCATVAFRVLTVWIYNNAGRSLFAVVVAHAVGTTARTAFPGGRAAYELADGSISYGILLLAALCVTVLWGPRTLSVFRGR